MGESRKMEIAGLLQEAYETVGSCCNCIRKSADKTLAQRIEAALAKLPPETKVTRIRVTFVDGQNVKLAMKQSEKGHGDVCI